MGGQHGFILSFSGDVVRQPRIYGHDAFSRLNLAKISTSLKKQSDWQL
jgi:hypothetical protein